eukprot:9433829-Ditylum_brightwellii.AAC.1
MKWMVNGKAAVPSGITSDALKSMVWHELDPEDEEVNTDADFQATMIHGLLLDFCASKLDFESWKQGILTPVPKSGDLSNPNKWRPICLLETSYK